MGNECLSQEEIKSFDVDSIGKNSFDGYISEVDLEYPDELLDFHNYYPLAPEKLETSNDMLPNYYRNISDKYGIKLSSANNLVPNLCNKSKYVVHYRNLQLYSSLEMKLTKVHRVLKFKQSDWVKNTSVLIQEREKTLLIALKKNFFKLIINSVYDKTMEKIRRRINVRLVNYAKDYKKYEIKLILTLDKPTYVRFSVIDLIKLLMHDFHCNYIKRKYDAELLFRDTDSLFNL